VSSVFRRATPADVPALAALYRDTALALGPKVYTLEQARAWARSTDDAAHFARYILDADTWVAEADDAMPCGFCGIAVHGTTGEVHSLYVRAALSRQGLGTALLAHAIAQARAAGARRFEAWATPFSKPVFERAGLRLERVVTEPYQGVLFDRYRMVGP
jgi:N-acetylglutamate synthase-like GNAT family acetyltransferase